MDKNNFRDLMIDIETMGKHERAVITQLAACFFDRNTGEKGDEFLINIDIDSCLDVGLEVTGDTIYWWLKQPKEIQNSLLKPEPISVYEAVQGFVEFLVASGPKPMKLTKVFCHSSFDYPKLISMFLAVSKKQNKKFIFPFSFTQVVDIRSLSEMSKINLSEYERKDAHNALADCHFQIDYVCDAFKKVKLI
jgi:hypothetical protein